MKLTATAKKVLEERYLLKDESGKVIETPEDMLRRVAQTVAKAEMRWSEPKAQKYEKEFFEVMNAQRFLPNTPTLINAGRPLGQLSACFVLPVEDSMKDIFGSLQNAALIHQSGGGTGFSFSRIRPQGARVSTTQGKASGPLSFMKVYNTATDCVKQGGARRGANMGSLRVDHPDILEFIDCKLDLKQLINFNLSVCITDKFMEAVEGDGQFVEGVDAEVRKETIVDSDWKKYAFLLGFNGTPYAWVDARYVWNRIAVNAWKMGEPGIIFIDRVNKYNLAQDVEKIEATNPCVVGDTLIMVKGYIPEIGVMHSPVWMPIKKLRGKVVEVYDGTQWTKALVNMTGEKQPVFKVSFINGSSVTVTEGHKWPVSDNGTCFMKKPTNMLKVGEFCKCVDEWNGSLSNGWTLGITKIASIENAGVADEVYCMTVNTNHCFVANGIITGNCGEQPLLPYESCNLGSINLYAHVALEDGEHKILWKTLEETIRLGTRFLDDVIEVNKYPLPEISEKTRAYRKIGLGIMGWADSLYALGIPYSSERARDLAREVMQFITGVSLDESRILAKERGAFPAWKKVSKRVKAAYAIDRPIRNLTTTTIAPTGTLSIIAGVSSGIEPVFAPVMRRRILDNEDFFEVDQAFDAALKEYYWDYSQEDTEKNLQYVYEQVSQKGSIQGVLGYKVLESILCTARDISPKDHVLMQAAFQEHTHNAISKTVNLPEAATVKDVLDVYKLAWDSGCKGVTVYRDGSRDTQVMNIAGKKTGEQKTEGAEQGSSEALAPQKSAVLDMGPEDFDPLVENTGGVTREAVAPEQNPIYDRVYHSISEIGNRQISNMSGYKELIEYNPLISDFITLPWPIVTIKAIQVEIDRYQFKTREDLEVLIDCVYAGLRMKLTEYAGEKYAEVIEQGQKLSNGVQGVSVIGRFVLGAYALECKKAKCTPSDGIVEMLVKDSNCISKTDVLIGAMLFAPEIFQEILECFANGKLSKFSEFIQICAKQEETPANLEIALNQPRPRSKKLHGITTQMRTGCGKLYVTVNWDDYGIVEIFTTTGKGGGCASQSEATSRVASIALRAGIDPKEIIKQLKGIRCPSAIRKQGSECMSCPDAIAKCLEQALAEGPKQGTKRFIARRVAKNLESERVPESCAGGCQDCGEQVALCKECGAPLAHESGCLVCYNCGWSKCD